ncbi:hypothetical protein NM688_g158 [Phlebia brevispora]|uniref:Uncharacterized protein n=1 Tax=Phlebia brevispora TaxID=194682 RepID=A0ACC1TF64_9APHY|nr:hypothetical protein NM688_g158 [Phlebia brevispora]
MPPKRNAAASCSRTRKRIKRQDEEDAIDMSYTESDVVDDDDESDASTYSQPRTKASKKSRKNPAGKRKGKIAQRSKKEAKSVAISRAKNQRGILQHLLGVPVEIVLEVLRRLSPLDLLQLSRTSKSFRALLMSRSSSHIWAAAWKNESDLPPCPTDVAAPAFTDLLYGAWCHTKVHRDTFWVCRIRLCRECTHHIRAHQCYGWDDIEYGYRPKQYPLECVIPELTWSYMDEEDYDNLDGREKKLIATKLEYLHAEICSEWIENIEMQEEERIESVKLAKQNEIISRLKAKGWTEVLENLTQHQKAAFEALPDVKRKKPLTDRIFQNMLPRLIPKLEAWKEEQEKPHRVATIQRRIDLLDDALLPIPVDHNTRPSIRDIVLSMPEAREVLDAPFRETVTVDRILEALPDFIDEWRRGAYKDLAELVRRGAEIEKIQLDMDPLTLAIGSVYYCTTCHAIVPLADALNHWCTRWRGMGGDAIPRRLTGSSVFTETADQYLTRLPCALLRTYEDMVRLVGSIVTAFGCSPETATMDDMDASDIRIFCTKCSTPKRRDILTWRSAVSHCKSTFCGGREFQKASEAEITVVRKFEETQLKEYAGSRTARCAHCPVDKRRINYSEEKLSEHLASCHGIDEPQATDRFYTTTLKKVWDQPVMLT